jgi:hypothetical protein
MYFLYVYHLNMIVFWAVIYNLYSEEEYNRRNTDIQRRRIDRLEAIAFNE